MLSLAEFKPLAGRIFVKPRRLQIFGLAEFKPKLLLSRPEIYSKPARGSNSKLKESPEAEAIYHTHGARNLKRCLAFCCSRCILTEGGKDKSHPGENHPDKRPLTNSLDKIPANN